MANARKVYHDTPVQFWNATDQRFERGTLESYHDETQTAHINAPGSGITFWLVPYRLIRREV